MKKLILLLSLVSFNALANEKGIGVMIGNPTGLTGKYWLTKDHAIDGGLAYSFGKHSDLSLHSDYLLHNPGAMVFDDVHPLDLYYGIGGRIEFADDMELGIRVPVGLAHRFTEHPVDIFGEVAPIVDLISRIGIELHIGVGARYYFN